MLCGFAKDVRARRIVLVFRPFRPFAGGLATVACVATVATVGNLGLRHELTTTMRDDETSLRMAEFVVGFHHSQPKATCLRDLRVKRDPAHLWGHLTRRLGTRKPERGGT